MKYKVVNILEDWWRRTGLRAKSVFDNIHNEKLRAHLLQAFPFWVGSLLTGIVAVLYARLFSQAEKLSFSFFHGHGWWMLLLSPLCFLGGWWLVNRFAPYARGSGIPQVMAAIDLSVPKMQDKVRQLLSLRVLVVKVASSIVMVVGGAAIGREGPTIQIAASIFRKVNELLPTWWPKISRRNMMMTGAAAGLAAAFNTPLGGMVFAIEELTRTHFSHFKTAIFTAVIIAGLTAQGLAGPYLYLGYPAVNDPSRFILPLVILAAVIAGLLGAAMTRIMLRMLRWKSRFHNWKQHVAYLVVSAVLLILLAKGADERILGSGKDLMTETLFGTEKYLPWYLPFLRITGPILSFTSGAAGGVFAPGLSAGASIGAVLSGWLQLAPADTNILIMSGMVAFLTGMTKTPFTSAILVLEMTDRHNLIFHLMLAGMVANLISIGVDRHSFYDHLKLNYLRELESVPDFQGEQMSASPSHPGSR